MTPNLVSGHPSFTDAVVLSDEPRAVTWSVDNLKLRKTDSVSICPFLWKYNQYARAVDGQAQQIHGH